MQHLREHGTFKPQTHDRNRDRTEKTLQAEEQILERDEEKPDISIRQLAAEVGVLQFVPHGTLKAYNTTFKRANFGACSFSTSCNLLRMVVIQCHERSFDLYLYSVCG